MSAFYFMSLSMKTIPVAISYAIWSAVGLVLITMLSAIRFNEQPDTPAVIGLILIVVGVFCLTTLSKMDVHV
jgi:small multidrug resistance pump